MIEDRTLVWATAAVGAASCLLGVYLGGIVSESRRKKEVEGVGGGTRSQAEARRGAQISIKNKAYHHNWLPCDVVVAGNEKQYHKCVRLVRRGENVLELGSHQGVTTRKISARAGPEATCIGIDMSEFVTRKAKERAELEQSKAIHFCADARDVRVARKLVTCDVHVIFIDVSGNRGPSLLLQLMESYTRCFKPRLIVVKSFKLENFHRMTKLSTEIC